MAITANGTHIIFNDSTTQATQAIEFVSGTVMLFRQNTAPTGWTKSSSFDNAALRVVSGTINASQSGVVPFTGAFANTTPTVTVDSSGLSAGATTLSSTQMPSHTHTVNGASNANCGSPMAGYSYSTAQYSFATGSTGGGSSHSHSMSGSATATSSAINLNVRYADAIIAAKD